MIFKGYDIMFRPFRVPIGMPKIQCLVYSSLYDSLAIVYEKADQVHLFDIRTNKIDHQLTGHRSKVLSSVYLENIDQSLHKYLIPSSSHPKDSTSAVLATSSSDETIMIWKITPAKSIKVRCIDCNTAHVSLC